MSLVLLIVLDNLGVHDVVVCGGATRSTRTRAGGLLWGAVLAMLLPARGLARTLGVDAGRFRGVQT